MAKDLFATLYSLDVSSKVEKTNGYSYLSWAFAWAEFRKAYPDAEYTIKKNENNLPFFESQHGIMVFTEVTAGGKTHEMWLPVLDGANKAMKSTPWEYSVRDKKTGTSYTKTVEPATMFDINKAIMRCLVKNIAMFGIGLYIYAGEDAPEFNKEQWLEQWYDAINRLQNVEELNAFFTANSQTITANKELSDACKAKKAELEKK